MHPKRRLKRDSVPARSRDGSANDPGREEHRMLDVSRPRRLRRMVAAVSLLAGCGLLQSGTSAQDRAKPAIVEVHQAGAGGGPLWYRVGRIGGSTIAWGDSARYDNGANPAVALEGDKVVEVHQAEAGVAPLWYRVGQVTGTTIQWGDSAQYDVGLNPAVALTEGRVAEVHQGSSERARGSAAPLWYRVGQVNGKSITWSNSLEYDQGLN